MAVDSEERKGELIVIGGLSAIAATALTLLFTHRPAAGAPEEDQIKYLTGLLEQIAKGNVSIIALLEAIKDAPLKVEVSTPWVARDPEQIFDRAIRAAETVDADKMVNYTESKRLLFKVESSLDQAAQIQLVGNTSDSYTLATNIDGPLPCVANGNISVGLAWDDWHPFVGVRVTTAVAPTTGMLKIWAVIQE
jgi:hypothetical protein